MSTAAARALLGVPGGVRREHSAPAGDVLPPRDADAWIRNARFEKTYSVTAEGGVKLTDRPDDLVVL